MSRPERRLEFSPKAAADFEAILRYTGERWGIEQLIAYRNQLDAALRRLTDHPDLAHFSAALPDSHRLYVAGSHVVVYRDTGATVAVVRVLHQRMNLPRQL